MSTKLTIQIDFGQRTKFFSAGKETILKDEEGKALDFNSMIDALNFMSQNGFEFVNAYAITLGSQNVYHYILKKKKE
jgi:uroporphyrinogen-III synthase